MNAQHIQSLIALNAARITALTANIADHIAQAKDDKMDGEISFMEHEYAMAGKVRRKLAKAVDTQRALKTELSSIHREARIETKTQKLVLKGVMLDFEMMARLTSVELEKGLDDALAYVTPKKADSRMAA